MTTDAVETSRRARPGTSARVLAAIDRTLTVVVLVGIALADVLAFNQLATQSPIDGILQLTVVGIGFAGAVEAIRRLAFGAGLVDRLLAVPVASLSIAALLGWRANWPTGADVVLCSLAAVLLVIVGLRSLARVETHPTATQVPGVLAVAQALVLGWFAVLAGLSSRAALFG